MKKKNPFNLKTQKLVLIFCFVLINSIVFSQTTLNFANSYTISDDVAEPSGLAFDKVNNQLFSVSDTGNIYRLSTTGNLLDTYNLSGDLEGISTYNTANTLLIAIEDTYQIIEYNYVTGTSTSHTMDYDNQEDTGSGIEGVTYNNNTGEIYFLNEKDPGALIVANNNFNVTNEYELTYSGDYSASYYVEETDVLWLGSDNSSAIYKCNTNGTVIETFDLTLDGDELDKLEGLAIDYANQLLYIVTDGGGELLVYDIITETVDDNLSLSSISNFDADGNSQTVTITSNINWTVSENTSWISLGNTRGSNNGSFSITTTENTTTSSRSATITVSGNDIDRSFTIFQEAAENTTPSLTFTPDPSKTYYIDSPVHNLRLAATGESEDAYTTPIATTGDDVQWAFVDKGNGYWHVQRAAGGSKPRLRTDNSVNADMQATSSSGTFTYYEITEGASDNTYFFTLPDGPSYKRLQIDNTGTVKMVTQTSNGTWESFVITEVDDNTDPSTSSCTSGTNLAENGTVVDFSAEQNTTNTVANLIDNIDTNRWSAQTFPQYATVDLGDEYAINQINLVTFNDRDYQFTVEGSKNSATSGFSTIVDATNNIDEGTINRTFSSQTVRYVKLTITGANSYTGEWASIADFKIICAGTSNKNNNKDLVTDTIFDTSVFPNPFTNTINITPETNTPIIIRLVDILGNTIKEKTINSNTSINNLQNLAQGIYFLQTINTITKAIKTHKFIKK